MASARARSERPRSFRDVSRVPRTYIPPDAEAEEVAAFRPRSEPFATASRGKRAVSENALERAQTRMRTRIAEPELETETSQEPVLASQTPVYATEETVLVPVVAVPAANPIAIRALTISDGDRLWDWVRVDEDGGRTLFGRVIASSVDVHAQLDSLRTAETSPLGMHAAIRALDFDGHHIGFVELNPMLEQERTALVTVYLAPQWRGQLAEHLSSILRAIATLTPYHLALPAPTSAWADLYRRVLEPLGFREHRLFVL